MGIIPDGGINEYHIYDKEGKDIYQIGCFGRGPEEYLCVLNNLQTGKDSTLRLLDHTHSLTYSLNGQFLQKKALNINYTGIPHLYQDSLIICYTNEAISLTSVQREKARRLAENRYILEIYSIPKQRFIQSYFPMKEITGLVCGNFLYEYKDKLCFYHDKNRKIYEISPHHTKVRYVLDKGKYDRLQTHKEYAEAMGKDVSFARIDMLACNETDQYVLGSYYFKRKFYIYVYNKETGITKNYRTVKDDLLGLPIKEGMPHFIRWVASLRFKQDYLWGTFAERYVDFMEKIKNRLGPEEWKLFCEKHPDFAQVYKKEMEKIENDTNDSYVADRILWRYHFK